MSRTKYSNGIKAFITFTALLFVSYSCKKEIFSPDQHGNNETIINENVQLIDTNSLELISTPQDLQNGILVYQSSGAIQQIPNGNILVDPSGDGLLRKVISSTVNGNQITYLTSQGKLTDAYKSVSVKMASTIKSGWSYNLSGTSIYSSGGLDISISSGSVNFDPKVNLDFDVTDGNITYLNAYLKNAPLSINATISASATGALQLASFEKTIASISKKEIFMVGWLPVIIVYKTDLVASVSADVSSSNVVNFNYTNNKSLNCGLLYNESGGWKSFLKATGAAPTNSVTSSSNLSFQVNVKISPVVSVKLYSVAGIELSAEAYLQYERIRNNNAHWNEELKMGLKGGISVNATIFDEEFTGFSDEKELITPYLYVSPKTISVLSGNNQSANENSLLANPLKVNVKDSKGNPVNNVKVLWEVTDGNGSLSAASSTTNSSGIASVQFTLGNTSANSVTAKILDGNGQIIGVPQIFSAAITSVQPFSFASTYSFISPTCSAPDSSEIALNTQGGIGPFIFSIDNGNTWYGPTSNNFYVTGHLYGNPLNCGTYNCKAVDNMNGSTHDTISVSIVLAP